MRAPCIINLENISTLSNWLGKRLPLEAHRDWIDRVLLRHVLSSQDCLQASPPTREELSSLHVFRAVAAGQSPVRFVPTERLMKDADLVVDWLAGLDERDPRLSRKLRRVTFDDALTMSQRWHGQLRKAAKRKEGRAIPRDPVGGPIVLEEPALGPGWRWAWLRSPEARKAEGEAMGHCVGGGAYESLDSSEAILSLRDENGEPRATLHLDGMTVLQAVTKGNCDIPARYQVAVDRATAVIGARLLVNSSPLRVVLDGINRRKDFTAYIRRNVVHRDEGPAIEWADGTRQWYRDGKRHREDGPAIEHPDRTMEWYRDGKLHRDDGPAVEWANGTREWYRDGQLHRDDGPAVEWAYGTKEWYRDGQLHCDDGPAVEWADGTKEWCRDGKFHREDGPAIEWADGSKSWYRHGKLHREDGPAIERADGIDEWWRNGERIPANEVSSQSDLPSPETFQL
jgi:hypothetical protein